jgi:addiction module RelB/DinJ family antitoxin
MKLILGVQWVYMKNHQTNQNGRLSIRIDEATKVKATEVFDSLGLDLSTAVKLFLIQAIKVNALPFDVTNNSIEEKIADRNRRLQYAQKEILKNQKGFSI